MGRALSLGLRKKGEQLIVKVRDIDYSIIYNNKIYSYRIFEIEYLGNSDIAISACGQTLYELAKIGTPTIGVCVADNQQNNIKGWKSIGFLEYAGWYNDKSILNNILNLIEKMNCKKVRKEKLLISKSIFNTCSPTLNIVDTLLEKFVKF